MGGAVLLDSIYGLFEPHSAQPGDKLAGAL
jgi:hypothetical protein